MVSFFTCTRSNQSRIRAIDKPDRSEQAFDHYDILEDPENIFTNVFSIVGHEKMIIFGVFDDFTSNFTYYDLYWRKVKVLTRKKHAIRFFIRPLDFSWYKFTREDVLNFHEYLKKNLEAIWKNEWHTSSA